MTWVDMDVAPVIGKDKEFAYEKEVDLSSVTTSAWILVPKGIKMITVALSVGGGGKGKVQTTISTVDTVKTGSPIIFDWANGEVSANTDDTTYPVTAIRLNQTFAGTTKLTVRAQ